MRSTHDQSRLDDASASPSLTRSPRSRPCKLQWNFFISGDGCSLFFAPHTHTHPHTHTYAHTPTHTTHTQPHGSYVYSVRPPDSPILSHFFVAARTHSGIEDDLDPVAAEYSIYLTPPAAPTNQILLLQYPNRTRARPYNARFGACPSSVRIKPQTGHVELDVGLNTTYNFNKYRSLQWGDALKTSQEIHNKSGTYGAAAGFHGAKPRAGRGAGGGIRDQADRENAIQNDLMDFNTAEEEGKVMKSQTLGGQISRDTDESSEGAQAGIKPIYFVGAFRGQELHLTKVDGTAQMRPQFHHLDAEDQRARIAASRAQALSEDARPPPEARALLAREKKAEQGEKEKSEDRMRRLLQEAEAEEWVELEYVDEDMEDAYAEFRRRMFVEDTRAAPELRSGMDGWEYLDRVSAPRRESPGRRRKRQARRKQDLEVEGEDAHAEGGETAARAGDDGEAGAEAGAMDVDVGAKG